MSVTQAAPMNPIANNHPHGKAHGTTSNQNCPPFFRRETQYAGQCAPVQFARVWHVAPKTRAATVTTVNNQNSEVACYLSILETGTGKSQSIYSIFFCRCRLEKMETGLKLTLLHFSSIPTIHLG